MFLFHLDHIILLQEANAQHFSSFQTTTGHLQSQTCNVNLTNFPHNPHIEVPPLVVSPSWQLLDNPIDAKDANTSPNSLCNYSPLRNWVYPYDDHFARTDKQVLREV